MGDIANQSNKATTVNGTKGAIQYSDGSGLFTSSSQLYFKENILYATNISASSIAGSIAGSNTINASTISGTTLYGTIAGSNTINASTIYATTLYGTASLASSINVLSNVSSTTLYPVLVASTGAQISYITSTASYLSFVPSTGTLTCQVLNAASDLNIKENIDDLSITRAKDLLGRLRPVEYTFINDPKHKKRFGFIAQEVNESFKDENLGIYENIDEKHFISYLELIGPLVKVVNYLVKKLDV